MSYGGGVNSTALLVECSKRGVVVDLILFADTGGEKPHTYNFIEGFSRWLVKHRMPNITSVRSPNNTLEEMCLRLKVLPSLAYGWKTCSQRFKAQPQNVFLNNYLPAKKEWKAGRKITKLIGYDADEPHRAKPYSDSKYEVAYPLIEWDMGRDECLESIKSAGLSLPGKSACFFCPSSRKTEIRDLSRQYPDLIERALAMEANAETKVVKGLGRQFSWADLLNQKDLFDEDNIDIVCECYDGE